MRLGIGPGLVWSGCMFVRTGVGACVAWACRGVNINEFGYLGMYVCLYVCMYDLERKMK